MNRESTANSDMWPVWLLSEWYMERFACRSKENVCALNEKAFTKFIVCSHIFAQLLL